MAFFIIVFFIGVIIAGIMFFPILFFYKKKLHAAKTESERISKFILGFQNNSARLAAAVRESAGDLSLSGSNDRISGDSHIGIIEKIENTENTIDQNVHIAAEIAAKTNSVSAVATKMEEDVRNGFVILEKNVKKMEDIKEKNSSIINGIISLSAKVSKIRDIVRIITTITDQTKVIAFNAALEAASAGETGKRFSVVAGEVNRLADDIAVLTRQIREQVEEIRNSSSSLIVYSEEGSDRIAEGNKLIKDLEDIFLEIRSGAEITSNQAKTITVFSQQQLKSSEQIHLAIDDVSQSVKSIIGASENAALTAGNIIEQTNELECFLTGEDTIIQGKYGD